MLLCALLGFVAFVESGCRRGEHDKSAGKTNAVRIETVVEHVSPKTNKKTAVFRRIGSSAIVYFSGMEIDADGAPNAYHPDGKSGLDSLDRAGDGGTWWALALDEKGRPVVQQSGEFKGFYVSMTWLSREDDLYSESDPKYYVDARTVPYLAVPKTVFQATGVDKGDLAYVFNEKNGRSSFAIVADWGTEDVLGEGSIALGKELGMDPDARTGGQDDGVAYVIFPGTAARPHWPRSLVEMQARSERLVVDWGGRDALSKLRAAALGRSLF
jgi:hypothetical protein